ncbi:MAG: hypothetical protein V7641_4976 [Blastocatellia bacterium]
MGDRAAFKSIYKAHQECVFNLTYYLLNDSRLVEDVVQTVFLKILPGLPGFRFEANLSTWIYQIAVNECQNQNRQLRLKQVSFESLLGSGKEVDDLAIPENRHVRIEYSTIAYDHPADTRLAVHHFDSGYWEAENHHRTPVRASLL